MIKPIIITGIAGTGKSSICGELIKRGYKARDIEDIDGLFIMFDKKTGKPFEKYDNYDFEKVKRLDWICDKNKLQKIIQENRNGVVYYCGTASNTDEILSLFDKMILLQANAETIKKRLSERTNNDFGRTTEVQKWVLSGKDHWEKHMIEKGAIVIDANRSLEEIADDIIEKIEKRESMMASIDLLELYSGLRDLGIQIWVDGGWGVDALLGQQTRPHSDLDITIQEKDLLKFREFLEVRGYKDIKREESKPWNFVLGDDKGHKIDVHVIVLDDKGNGIYGPLENGQMYPADSLTGNGTIDSQPVKCISPDWMIKFHSGYELKEKDFRDISALCKKFGISLPKEFDRFKKAKRQAN